MLPGRTVAAGGTRGLREQARRGTRSVVRLAMLFALTAHATCAAPTSSASPASNAAPSLASLAWLAGTWSTAPDAPSRTDERWDLAAGNAMLGVSRTLAERRPVHHELLRLTVRAGRVRYLAAPEGQAITEFTLVTSRPGFARFESAGHDFPQWVEYRREGDRLRAQIGAASTARTARWDFTRVAAPVATGSVRARVCREGDALLVTHPACVCSSELLCAIFAGESPARPQLALFDSACDACLTPTARCAMAAGANASALAAQACEELDLPVVSVTQ